MKKSVMKMKLPRRIINLLVVCLLFGGVMFAWQTVAELQTKDNVKTAETKNQPNEKTISIHAAGRGKPFVNFTDGTDLTAPDDAKNTNSQPQVLASADFDSDGIEDLVTADASGNLKFYHGNSLRKGEIEKGKNAETEPFELTGKSFSLNIAPDYLFAGDFNADGGKDVLAAAKGTNFLVLLSGDGRGNFSAPNALAVDGRITAIQTGEIGRKDGQTDLAVAFVNKSGAFLAVFEHPEGAFKHKPEIFKLSSPATDLAIGNLDEDFYADIAVASGNDLTIIHGRGQAYPWDLMPDLNIKRPDAFVAVRKMPFAISALTVGRFGTKRGESLAMLGQDGNVYQIESNSSDQSSKNIISAANYNAAPNPFVPSADDALNSAVISAPQISREDAEKFGLLNDRTVQKNGEISDAQKKLLEEQFENFKKTDQKDIDSKRAENAAKSIEDREKTKDAFLKSIAGKPSTLANWNLKTLVSNSQFSGAAASGNSRKILRVNVSDSNSDDILLIDSVSNQLQIVSQVSETPSKNQTAAQVTTLETEGSPLAVLPVRLNMDALTDLVVLRQGASVPSVVMTAPTETLTVNSTDDTGDCQPGNPCSLRNAILYSNSHSGVETIEFNLNGATITLSQELPNITDAVNINGSVNGNGQPSFEINGANVPAPATGLAIRTSNSFIYGLAINSFKSVPINNGQSQLGGSGITIFSNSSSPNNGNNVILNNFLGTDKTGSLDKGNAVGLLIFDSDNNQIIQNVISGNGSQQVSGIGIDVTAGNSNLFLNNIVGLNSLGTGKVANTTGVFLTGLNNTFGGDGAGDGNTVSGNGEPYFDIPTQCGGDGLVIPVLVDVQTHELLTFGNTISGNRFGTNPAGNVGLGNCYRGIYTEPLTGTLIGSITETGRNIISDNGYDAIWCGTPFYTELSGLGFCAIVGNNIGTDVSGTIPIRNDLRNIRSGAQPVSGAVLVTGNGSFSNIGAPGGTTLNGACTGFCNLISGNDNSPSFNSDSAVDIGGVGVIGIFNNYIGTNKNGTQAISNYSAVSVATTIYTNFLPTYLVGGYGTQDGNSVSFGNLISGNNGGVSIGVGGNTVGNYLVLGNKIGTDASGTFAVPNVGYFGLGGSGVTVNTGFGFGITQIGDPNPLGRNIISGNGFDGIFLFTGYNASVANNLIGVNSSLAPLGNGGNGIELGGFFGVGNIIGGGSSNAANIIQNNTKAGILVKGVNYFANNLRGNSISNNGGLGIDLKAIGGFGDGDGVTENDCRFDEDTGANDLQNFPVLFDPAQNGDNTLTVNGTLRSKAKDTYTIDFYSSQTTDPSNYGEGENYLGSVSTTTNGNGFATFTYTTLTPVSANLTLTATATDLYGSTSEFSCAAGQCTEGARTVEEFIEKISLVGCIIEAPIIVNTTSDLDDADFNDAVCDIDVTNNIPDECSLRAAIREAERRPGTNRIYFAIDGQGVQTISPATPFLTITQPVYIDGDTQSLFTGGQPTANPLIQIRGDNGGILYGLVGGGAGGIHISGLVINGFASAAIVFAGGNSNSVKHCYIGLDPSGLTAAGNPQPVGISVQNSSRNIIGGTEEGESNVISNNVKGILIQGSSTQTTILNNKIGTNVVGSEPIPNNDGVVLDGVQQNTVGDNLGGNSGNVISGNGRGVVIKNGSQNNKVIGNLIGTKTDGVEVLGNTSVGVSLESGAKNNLIGGDTTNDRNIIGGSLMGGQGVGVLINTDASTGNTIIGNYIGINRLSNGNLPNGTGIIVGISQSIIGKESATNYIGGNSVAGISLTAPNNGAISDVSIIANHIGIDSSGAEHANGKGIDLNGNLPNLKILKNSIAKNNFMGIRVNGSNYTIGGNSTDEANSIYGNGGDGIFFETNLTQNKIKFNFIGTLPGGTSPSGNDNGILLRGKNHLVLGNVISGNINAGIRIEGNGANEIQENTVSDNFIGTNADSSEPLPNKTGIELTKNARKNNIERNVISGNTEEGIRIGAINNENTTNNENKVIGNFIGTNLSGNAAMANRNGIVLSGGAFDNEIGEANSENVISGNTENGIFITKFTNLSGQPNNETDAIAPTGNKILRNRIGVSKVGVSPTLALANKNGVLVSNGANNNTIGGMLDFQRLPHEGNVISGNNEYGIKICRNNSVGDNDCDQSFFQTQPFGNKIRGNVIGLSGFLPPNGDGAAMPNLLGGIYIRFSSSNRIGDFPDSSGDYGNVVCSNGDSGSGDGITIYGSFLDESILTQHNVIIKNHIGVRPDREFCGNQGSGINVSRSPDTRIGFNIIGYNTQTGISAQINFIEFRKNNPQSKNLGATPSLTIVGNLIGVTRDDSGNIVSAGNGGDGIKFENVQNALIGDYDSITSKNIVSGNGGAGIKIEGDQSSDNTINNTIIGTDDVGTHEIGNGGAGIQIRDAANTVIGDPDYQKRNSISGNGGAGISILGESAITNKIINNFIGIAPNGNAGPGNTGDGILISEGAGSNEVGGREEGKGNLISNSGGAGIRIAETAGNSNLVDRNPIFANTGLGIDVGSTGLTPNDPNDNDEGANRGQNYPEIVSKQIVNNELIVGFKVDSAPENSNYGDNGLYVEFFKSDASGEGERFLGFTYYTIGDHSGNLAAAKTVNLGNIDTLGINANDLITATATDADNNTSEFFPPFAPTAANVTIGGRIVTANGQGIRNVRVILTDQNGTTRSVSTNSFGIYGFENVEVGQTLIVSVAHKKYQFETPSQVFQIDDARDDLNFTALP